ncbi:hypothetical protein GIB67_026095 [Kingdonia uniflora]|uniref:Photosystem I assembly protein Ycf4 n=1 Tax=Kingdonia uniflora TaxID=39325 RepID=A0A7J7M2Y3_9MAGN|nr:hypothetical protein GIB67_026095 [Kingdonia uniflora]
MAVLMTTLYGNDPVEAGRQINKTLHQRETFQWQLDDECKTTVRLKIFIEDLGYDPKTLKRFPTTHDPIAKYIVLTEGIEVDVVGVGVGGKVEAPAVEEAAAGIVIDKVTDATGSNPSAEDIGGVGAKEPVGGMMWPLLYEFSNNDHLALGSLMSRRGTAEEKTAKSDLIYRNRLVNMLLNAPECFGLCSYLLSGYTKRDVRSNEATTKYLLMGGASSSILVHSFSWLYGSSGGEIELQEIVNGLINTQMYNSPGISIALIFIVVGIGFKLSPAPSHQWTPDVYEGVRKSFFFPQGIVMSFYGIVDLFINSYLWRTFSWNVGSGYDRFDRKEGIVCIFRWGFLGINRRIFLRFLMRDIQSIRIEVKEGFFSRHVLYMEIRGQGAIPLTRTDENLTPREIEQKAAELAYFLRVPIEIF